MDLNLPCFDYRLSHDADGVTRIFDCLRGRFVALTPEEWVRQHFVNFLITERSYPRGLMANEVSLKLNRTSRLCDTLVYSRSGRPLAVIEYKAPTVAITQKVFDQIARYNSVVGSRYLIVSNGLTHYCCSFDEISRSYRFMRDIPRYDALSEEICQTD